VLRQSTVPSEVLFGVYAGRRRKTRPNLAALSHAREALFGVAAAALLLLFIGIHNA
jgi:hypothetical protein